MIRMASKMAVTQLDDLCSFSAMMSTKSDRNHQIMTTGKQWHAVLLCSVGFTNTCRCVVVVVLIFFSYMSRVMRKTVFRAASDQFRHKSDCTATEDD